jgi:D-amino-acid dehydrogenase
VVFRFNADVAITQAATSVGVALRGDGQSELFDHIVLCTGALTGALAAPLKIKLPMITIAGQSVSLRIREPLNAPRSAVFDARSQTHIVRIGNRVRISGGAILGGLPSREDKALTNILYKCLQNYFPGAAHLSEGVQTWRGSFNLTTDGLPAIGKTAVPHVSLNVGHGPNGWAMAAGAANLLSAAISGRPAALDSMPFSPLRFG